MELIKKVVIGNEVKQSQIFKPLSLKEIAFPPHAGFLPRKDIPRAFWSAPIVKLQYANVTPVRFAAGTALLILLP